MWHIQCYSCYKPGDKSWMMKGLDCDHIIVDRCLFLLSCLLWSLYCLFIDLRLLITSLWYLQNFLLYFNVLLSVKRKSLLCLFTLTGYPTYTLR
jgi:hypothetical protein